MSDVSDVSDDDCKARLLVARKALKSILTVQRVLAESALSEYSKGLVVGIELGLQQIDLILGDLTEAETK